MSEPNPAPPTKDMACRIWHLKGHGYRGHLDLTASQVRALQRNLERGLPARVGLELVVTVESAGNRSFGGWAYATEAEQGRHLLRGATIEGDKRALPPPLLALMEEQPFNDPLPDDMVRKTGGSQTC